MLILLPAGCRIATAAGRPWASWALAGLVLLLFVAERAFLHLPSAVQELVGQLAWARLYSDPSAGLFRPWQLWTHALLQPGSLALALHLGLWLWLAPAVERRLGAALAALLLLTGLPLAAGVVVLGALPMGDLGLGLANCWLAGALSSLETRPRAELWCGWWLLHRAGQSRLRVPVPSLLIPYLIAQAGLLSMQLTAEVPWPSVMILAAAAHLAAFALAQLTIRLLLPAPRAEDGGLQI